MGDVIVDAEAVADDVVQFLVEAFADNPGHLPLMLIHRALRPVADLPQLVIRSLNHRREGAAWHRAHGVEHREDLIRIPDDNLMDQLLILQEGKALFHLLRKAKMLVGIFGADAQIVVADVQRVADAADPLRHDVHIPEDLLILRAVVGIRACNNRLSGFSCHGDDPLQYLPQAVHRGNRAERHFRRVVARGLDLDVVIPLHRFEKPCVIPVAGEFKDLVVETRAADQKMIPLLFKTRPPDPRFGGAAALLGGFAHDDKGVGAGFGDHLIEALEAFMVFRQHRDMASSHLAVSRIILDVIELFQRLCAHAHGILHHRQEDGREHLGIVVGAVGNFFVIGDVIEIRHIAQAVEMPFLKDHPGEIQGIDHRILQRRPPDSSQFLIQEMVVKRRIVGNQYIVADPGEKIIRRLRKAQRRAHHGVGDIRLAGDHGGNRHRRPDELLAPVDDHVVFDLDRTEFDDVVKETGKTRGLKVKAHESRIIQQCITGVSYNHEAVIGHVHLTAEPHLEGMIGMIFRELCAGVVGFDKALHIGMVHDADAGVADRKGVVHDLFRRAYPVHFRHVGMHVQLDSFLFGIIGRNLMFDLLHRHRLGDIIPGVGIEDHRTEHPVELTLLQISEFLFRKVLAFKAFDRDRIGAVEDGQGFDQLAVLGGDLITGKHFALKADVLRLIPDIPEFHLRPVFPLHPGIPLLFLRLFLHRSRRLFFLHDGLHLRLNQHPHFHADLDIVQSDPGKILLQQRHRLFAINPVLFPCKDEGDRLRSLIITER